MSKQITGLIFFSIFFSNLFAISLIEKSKELGMSVYYDSLSESGMLEKNGHFVSFKIDNPIILFDGSLFYVTDAPLIEKNQITVRQDF